MMQRNKLIEGSAWIFVLLGFVGLGYGFLNLGFVSSSQLNLFGDFIGGFTASLWALSGVLFFYLAILIQREELSLTREELREQRLQLGAQNEMIARQRFENTFFNLLGLYNEIVDNIATSVGKEENKGKLAFSLFYEYFSNQYEQTRQGRRFSTEDELIETAYGNFFQAAQSNVGHYFRHLYNILKFIDESIIDQKSFYAGIVRSQLSTYEHLLLFYNCLTSYGNAKFKPLIEKYHMLNNLSDDDLLTVNHKLYYAERAFADSAKGMT